MSEKPWPSALRTLRKTVVDKTEEPHQLEEREHTIRL